MRIRNSILSLLAVGAMALTSASPAAAFTTAAKPVAPLATQNVPLQVRDAPTPETQYRNFKGHRYYNGHRGYRTYRDGYRRHNGFWYPRAAFGLGIIIAPQVQQRVIRNYGGNAHINWCENRYRSYRIRDNSWQPNYGPRRVCVSPYY